MNKKAIVVICAAVGLVIPALSFMTNRAIIKMNAERTTYTMTLDEHNAPALTDSPSNGSFTVNTAGGNPIQFNYESFVAASGNLASMLPSGSLTNNTALTGVFSVTASYMGTMGLYYGLTRADVNSIALTSGTEVELPIQACFISFKPLTAVTITSIQIKYECSLSAEAEEQKAMEAKRYELLDALEFEREDYRSDELDALDAVAAPIVNDIMNADTMSELEAISLAPFNTALANAKTNAELMVEEAFEHPHLSRWPLVNQHAANYVHTPSAFNTKGLGGDDVAYLTSPYLYENGFEMVMRCHNTSDTLSDCGIIIAKDSVYGDGLDGYVINYDYVYGNHMYLQVYRMLNGYSTTAVVAWKYIGGWIYNRGTGDLRLDDIRVIYDGTNITFMNEDDYQNGLYDIKVVVDLAAEGGYTIAPGAQYRFTFFTWEHGCNYANSLEIKKLAMSDTVISKNVACEIADEVIASYDSTKYESEEQALFNAKIAEIDALRTSGTYAAIMEKVNEFIELLKTLPTAEQKVTKTRAKQVLDNIFSFGDNTKSTPSYWELVNTNVAGWSHTAGTHSFTTNNTAGYIMDAETHEDFMMVFKVDGVHNGNPYGALTTKAILIGASASSVSHDGQYYFGGMMISLSNNWGFQFHEMNNDGSNGVVAGTSTFRGGISMNAEGITFKIVVQSGSVTIYTIDNLGVETRMSGVVGNYEANTVVGTDVWNISVPAGHVGFMSWGGESTFHLLEFQDL